MYTFKVLGALLCYPDAELKAAVPELRAALDDEALLGPRERRALEPLLDALAARDLYELQERYVLLFDRTRSLSLHLFEHVHGESRDRGQALVNLMALYRAHGLVPDPRELPDYLPLFLEFLSRLPADEARALLDEPAHIVAALGERLARRASPYRAVLAALATLARTPPAAADLEAMRGAPDDDPEDTAALDRAWEDTAVTFGPGEGCTVAAQSRAGRVRVTLDPRGGRA